MLADKQIRLWPPNYEFSLYWEERIVQPYEQYAEVSKTMSVATHLFRPLRGL